MTSHEHSARGSTFKSPSSMYFQAMFHMPQCALRPSVLPSTSFHIYYVMVLYVGHGMITYFLSFSLSATAPPTQAESTPPPAPEVPRSEAASAPTPASASPATNGTSETVPNGALKIEKTGTTDTSGTGGSGGSASGASAGSGSRRHRFGQGLKKLLSHGHGKEKLKVAGV